MWNKCDDCWWRRATILLFLVALLIAAVSYRHYGISWDYEVHDTYGQDALRWYKTFGSDSTAVTHPMKYYGTGFEHFANLFRVIIPGEYVTIKMLATFVFGLCGALACSLIASRVAGPAAGFVAPLFLLLTPMYYGHSFINHKDLPLATAYAFAILAIVYSLETFPRVSSKQILALGLAFGLTFSIRVGALFLFGVLAFAWGTRWLLLIMTGADSNGPTKPKFLAGLFFRGVAVLLLAWGFMALLWPFALIAPIRGPWEAIAKSAQYPWSFAVLFNGRFYVPPNVPWNYIPYWFLVSLPEFLFLGALAGIVAIFRTSRASIPALFGRWETSALLSILCAIFLPIALVLLKGSTVYDGVRHFLFVLPLLAVLAAWGTVAWARQATEHPRFIGLQVMVVSLLATMSDMAALHPYEYVYFNRLFGGGLAREADRYETDYWATCSKEAIDWLAVHYPRGGAPNSVKIAGWMDHFQLSYYVKGHHSERPDFAFTPNELESTVYLTTTRFGAHILRPEKLIHTINRAGAPLCYIWLKP